MPDGSAASPSSTLGHVDTRWPLLAGEGIRTVSARRPDKPALRLLDETGAVTAQIDFRTLTRRINRVANGCLGDLGLSPGDHAAILAPNCLEYLEIVCGLGMVGIAVAKPSPRLTARELQAVIDDSDARAVFVHASNADTLRDLDLPKVDRIIVIGDAYEDWLSKASDADIPPGLLADETSDFVLPYTSGTTGKPKGVRVTHRSRTLTFYGMGVEFGCFGPDDHFLGIAPLCHGAGFAFGLAPIFFGGTCDILAKFRPETTLRALKEQAHSGVFMVPTHFNAIFGAEQAVLDANRPSTLKAVISNAAPLPQATKEKIVDYFGDGLLHECYGSTEAGIVSNLRPQDQLRKVKCVGLPFANTQIKLLDEEGREVPQGEIGELYSRSPYLFNGYWGLPQETEDCLRDGWVTAGDLGQLDEEGYLYIVDRKKDMIISGGLNVYPREIEEVLYRHPAITEAAVIGIPDDHWGEKIAAVIVEKPDEAVSDEDLEAYCREHLADYKTPREIRRIDALPRNPSGKVVKGKLREVGG